MRFSDDRMLHGRASLLPFGKSRDPFHSQKVAANLALVSCNS